jgi:protein involved in polysaccharide export with SLBB domain
VSWRTIILGGLLVALLGVAGPSVGQLDGGQYLLAPGDVIQIRVFGEPDLSFDEIRLDDSGSFSYPFIGQVGALGMTAGGLERKLRAGLDGDYLINPRVSVSVVAYRDFFVNGEVRNPGGYPWQPGLTMRQAVSMAGGLTERASQRRMSIIRAQDSERQPEPVNMDSPVNPGDIIEIRQGLF